MDRIKPLFTATATAIGGRNGHTETSDGVVMADLSAPKEWAARASRGRPRRSICSPQAMPPVSAGRLTSWQSRRSATLPC